MKLSTLFLLLAIGCVAHAATPIQNLNITGDSQQTGGTFTIQTGVVWTFASGSTLNLSAGTLTLATGQVGWTKVSKTGSSLADLSTRSASDLSSGTLDIARGGTGIGTAPGAGKLLIGKSDGTYALATLTGGTNVTITNGSGTITVSAAGGGGGGAGAMTDLSDVGISSPTNGQILRYDGASSKWVNADTGPDMRPASPNAHDDEFDTADTLPGGASAKWTWQNQQSATATVKAGGLVLSSAQYTNPIRIYQAVTGNFTITAHCCALFVQTNYNEVGINVGDTSTGRIVTFGIATDTGVMKLFVQRWTNITTFSSAPTVFVPISRADFYLRIVRDSTNLTFSYSVDGRAFAQVYQEAKATWLTGGQDNIGLHIRPNGTAVTMTCDWFRVQ